MQISWKLCWFTHLQLQKLLYSETYWPAILDRSACGLAPSLSVWLNLLFTFTYLFVSHAQPDGDRLRADKQTNCRPYTSGNWWTDRRTDLPYSNRRDIRVPYSRRNSSTPTLDELALLCLLYNSFATEVICIVIRTAVMQVIKWCIPVM